MDNASPTVVSKSSKARACRPKISDLYRENDIFPREEIDTLEVFEWIRNLRDPEYPLTLEELRVVAEEMIEVDNKRGLVTARFTPTVPHCSQAILIGLMIKSTLMWVLPTRFRTSVYVTPGTHSSEKSINKQLEDKERVMAALENVNVMSMIVRGVTRTRTLDEVVTAALDTSESSITERGTTRRQQALFKNHRWRLYV